MFCLHEFRSDRLTKGHPAADNLRALLHIRDGSDGETPVRYGPPEMLNKQTNKWLFYIVNKYSTLYI